MRKRTIFVWLGGVTLVLIGIAIGLFTSGFRLVRDSGGMPRLLRQQAPVDRAAEIARHREAQRTAPAPAPPPASVAASPAPYWTDFRGPRRDGDYRERPILTAWPATGLRPMWKQPVGGGHASFVVARGRAFTIEQRGGNEVIAAYDVATGRELWTMAWPAAFSETYGGDGPRATPTWHDGVLYALGATGELRALDDATGRVRWRTNILDDAGAENLQWGMSAAPLIVNSTVIVVPGGSGGRSVAAYDRQTGKKAWSALDDQAAYASPMLVRIGGVEQVLVFTGSRLVAISLDGAQVLWEFPWPTQTGINPSQPLLLAGDRVFISTGYGMGAVMLQIARDGDRFTVRELWRTNRMKNQFTSSLYHDGFIYGLDDAILACIDAATGELQWKGGRYGYGQVILASGHLIVVTEGGDLALVRATPERHVEVARFPVLEGRTWNHPAIADGYLLIRNINEMAAFDLRVR